MLKECTINEDYEYLSNQINYYNLKYVKSIIINGHKFNFFTTTWKYINNTENQYLITVITLLSDDLKDVIKLTSSEPFNKGVCGDYEYNRIIDRIKLYF